MWSAIAFAMSVTVNPMCASRHFRHSLRADGEMPCQAFRKPSFFFHAHSMRRLITMQCLHLNVHCGDLNAFPLALCIRYSLVSLRQDWQVLFSFVPGTASSSVKPAMMSSTGGMSPSNVGRRVSSGPSEVSELSYLSRSDPFAEGMLSVMVRFNLHSA